MDVKKFSRKRLHWHLNNLGKLNWWILIDVGYFFFFVFYPMNMTFWNYDRSLKNGILLPYDVPTEIFEIEQNKGSFSARTRSEFRTNETEYIEEMTRMIFLEEAAQSKDLLQFNHKNIKLEYKSNMEFQIKIDVSVTCDISLFSLNY